MAVNSERSMNADFNHGLVEGSFKQENPDRGGQVEPTTAAQRRKLFQYYGLLGQ